MSTPATFIPNTPTPTPTDQSGGLGGAYEPTWDTNHRALEQRYKARQEDIALAKAHANAIFQSKHVYNTVSPQSTTSIFDTNLIDRRSALHLAPPHY